MQRDSGSPQARHESISPSHVDRANAKLRAVSRNEKHPTGSTRSRGDYREGEVDSKPQRHHTEPRP